ncbi:MAG: DUF3027 domain-containing protein [Candidatus Nanopelagicales bacterium]
MTETTPVRPRRAPALDAACRDAVELARTAVLEIVPEDHVGAHLSVIAEDDRVVTHRFSCLDPGYRGWVWAVTVARASRAKTVTVAEIAMLPGPGALVAPPWLPWSERLEPGDLGVGDVLPTEADDPRLAPGWSGLDDLAAASDEPGLRPNGWEIGIGRRRVLSPEGRDDAATRWISGDTGPQAAMARSAPGTCSTCGFLMPIGGPTGSAFGVCANGMSPADGRVVALTYGCGAHSEATPERTADRPRG